MNLIPKAIFFCTFSIAPLTAIAETQSVPPPPKTQEAPDTVRVQPRGSTFAPNSPEENAVQDRIRIFNERQQTQDEALDKKLKICRGC